MGDSRTVETTVTIAASPGRAIQAFLRDEDLRAWWKVSRSLVVPEPGGVWSIAWDRWGEEQTFHSWTGVIRRLHEHYLFIDPLVQNEPDRPLFGPMALEIRAEPSADGTALTVLHHGYQRGEHWDWIHNAVVRGWESVLADLQGWFESEE